MEATTATERQTESRVTANKGQGMARQRPRYKETTFLHHNKYQRKQVRQINYTTNENKQGLEFITLLTAMRTQASVPTFAASCVRQGQQH